VRTEFACGFIPPFSVKAFGKGLDLRGLEIIINISLPNLALDYLRKIISFHPPSTIHYPPSNIQHFDRNKY
jgi:hypothetical protein